MMITYTIPIKTVSLANTREHWAVKAKRAKGQRAVARLATLSALHGLKATVDLRISLTRLGKRKMDRDNMIGGLKHVIDGIADALGIDDGSDSLSWEYAQEVGKVYGVRVVIGAR